MRRLVASVGAIAVAVASLIVAPGAAGAPVPIAELSTKADDWVPEQIQPTKIPLKWSRATLNDQVTLDRLGRRPVVNAADRVWILACEREAQLDCVESIGLVDAGGTYTPGTLIRGNTFDVTHRTDGVKPYAEHTQIWDVPGLVVDGKDANIEIAMAMGGDEGHGFPGLNMMINFADVDLRPSTPTDPYGCRFIDRGQCLSPPIFPDGTVLRIVTRVSWLAPSAITVRGKDVTTSIEEIGTGARRITITGSPMLLQSQGGRAEIEAGRPQWVTSSFDFGMYDPRLESTPGGECAVDDPIILANNAQGAGLPSWRSDQGRLDLRMAAPHHWSDGKTEWRGFYETVISGDVARCMWGVDPRVTSYLSLEVYDEDGQEKAATTAIGFKGGMITVRAYDFTFSSNTVSAQVKVKAGKACFTKGVKIRNLVCTKKGKKLVWAKPRR